MKNPVKITIFTLIVFRIMLLLANPLSSVIGFGDLGNFFRLSQIPGWPYFQFWSEYPPIFPFLSKLIFFLARGQEGTFVYLLFLLLTLVDALNLFLFAKLTERLWSGQNPWIRLGAYLFVLLGLPFSWWYFEPLVITTLLAGLLWILEEKPLRVGWVVGAGILIKMFPVLLLPLALKKLGWKRGLLSTGIALGLVGLVFGSLWLVSPEFTQASVQSQGMKGSWETIWAVIDGNTLTGIIGPMVDRFDPLKASQTSRNLAVISPIITLVLFAGMGLVVFFRSKLSDDLRASAFALVTFGIFFLWSPGWSVQWVLYLLPLILLVFPIRTGGLLTLMLMVVNLLEWPVIYQINLDYVPLTIVLRTLLLVLLSWMAYQLVSGKLEGGRSYTSGLRSEKTDR